MQIKLFIVLLAAHMLTDYVLQGPRMVACKQRGDVGALLLHVFIYWVCASLLSLFWLSWAWAGMIAAQSLLHLLLDYSKCRLADRWGKRLFELELADLVLHLTVIWLSIIIFNPGFNESPILRHIAFMAPTNGYYLVCLHGAAVAFLCRGGTSLVRKLMGKSVDVEVESDDHGRMIGNLERLFIYMIIIFSNSLTAIGFVITAKSIARFKELENKRFAEYYLLGTLTSSIIAVAVGKAVAGVGSLLG